MGLGGWGGVGGGTGRLGGPEGLGLGAVGACLSPFRGLFGA